MKVLLCTANARFFHVSLALHSIRSNGPDKTNLEIDLKEYTINQEIRDIFGDIISQNPDVIGFGLYIWNRELIFRLGKMIKREFPGIYIVLGGPEVSYTPKEILEENDWVDSVVLGEGEISFWQLMETLDKKSYAPVLGVAQRGEKKTSHWEYQEIEDLNQLNFAYAKSNEAELKNRILYYESSRGCPFSCSYCLSGLDGMVRNRNTELVTKELEMLIAKDIRQVKFVDRTFNADPKHFNEIIDFLVGIDKPLNFHFEMDAAILKEETIERLAALPEGRVQLEIGIQSTNEKTLQAVGRHHAFQKEAEIIKTIKEKTSIHLHLDLIAGLPFESMEIFEKSFNEVFALEPDQLQLGFLKMLQGSKIRNQSEVYKYHYDEKAPYEVVSNPWLSGQEFHRLKLIEHCLEETWNSGRLQKTIRFISDYIYEGNVFRFFKELSCVLDDSSYLMSGRNGRWWVERIFELIPLKWGFWSKEIIGCLKWDVITMEKGRWKPEFLGWTDISRASFWQNDLFMNDYLPGYQFKSWRDIQRLYIVEKISPSLLEGVKEEEFQEEETILIQLEESFKWQRIKIGE